MIKKYISKFTGTQIDEAVHAIVENDVQLEDLSEDLINTIKSWSTGEMNLVLATYNEFPETGEEKCLYVAIDQNKMYIWDAANNQYQTFIQDSKDYSVINGGGAAW